jgi:hypothetical protein
MGKLLDEIHEDHKPRQKALEVILAKLDSEDRNDLIAALLDPTIRSSSIHRVLNKRGIKIGYDRVAEYRRELIAASESA